VSRCCAAEAENPRRCARDLYKTYTVKFQLHKLLIFKKKSTRFDNTSTATAGSDPKARPISGSIVRLNRPERHGPCPKALDFLPTASQ